MTAESAAPVRRCAVLGSPIQHSLSPVLHRTAYAELGLSGWSYTRHEVTAEQLATFVDGLDHSWRGLSLTMPLKEAVLGLGVLDPVAELAAAGNTLLLGPERTVYNTDVAGLVAAVRDVTADPLPVITVLGAGATARSAVISAAQLGASRVQVVARTPARAEAIRPVARQLGLELAVLDWTADPPPADLLVSTVTSGAVDSIAERLVDTAGLVFDVVYDPWPTGLARAAGRSGRTVLSGLDLLVEQAALQVELMTGRRPNVQRLRAAGLAALTHRGRP